MAKAVNFLLQVGTFLLMICAVTGIRPQNLILSANPLQMGQSLTVPTGSGATAPIAAASSASTQVIPGSTAERLQINAAIAIYSEQYGLNPAITAAQIEQESSFVPTVFGDNGESVGLGQIQKLIWDHYCADLGEWRTAGQRTHPNVECNSRFMADLLDYYDGDYRQALQAYNAGQPATDRGYTNDYPELVLARVAPDWHGIYGEAGWRNSTTKSYLHDGGARDIVGYSKEIYAPFSGTVTIWGDGFTTVCDATSQVHPLYHGNPVVRVENENGDAIQFLHSNPNPALKSGDFVSKGTFIATEGSYGYSCGSHLHVQAWEGGVLVDPYAP